MGTTMPGCRLIYCTENIFLNLLFHADMNQVGLKNQFCKWIYYKYFLEYLIFGSTMAPW